MHNSDKRLKAICELSTLSGNQLTGVFVKPGSNIWLTGRINISEFRRIDRSNFLI